jgi:hypothetical protein
LNPLRYQPFPALSAALDSLGPLFGGIVQRSSSPNTASYLRLFDIYGSFFLLRSSLSVYRSVFTDEVRFPFTIADAVTPNFILQAAFICVGSSTGPLPSPSIFAEHSASAPDYIVLNSSLIKWVRGYLDCISDPKVVKSGDLHPDEIIIVIRALYHCYAPHFATHPHSDSLRAAVNSLGALAIHRYSRAVLQKIASSLLQDVSTVPGPRTQVAFAISKLVEVWCSYCEAELPRAFKVSIQQPI